MSTQQMSPLKHTGVDTKTELDGKISNAWQELRNPAHILQLTGNSGNSDK
jgi:hypothetical protein